MTTTLTYLQFHLAFLLPAVMLLAATGVVSRGRIRESGTSWSSVGLRRYWVGVAIITVVAIAYTTPWDNLLIARGVWWYGDGTTIATVGHAPIEEYLFILVQPWLTALWLSHLSVPTEWPAADRPVGSRALALLLAAGIGVAGWRLLSLDATFYLGATLAWAAPVIALQWAVGAPQLWARRRLVTVGTLVPTLYLCTVDRVAIELGIWVLSEQYTTGLYLLGLPVEEATFFLVTNLFVVQGLVLYRPVVNELLSAESTPGAAWRRRLRTLGIDIDR
ncbi:lycopene cyclase domain-containing protein [Halobellus clavatus]|uniref:Lycopene cyclase domain-containing protein n=1 Tax=Halobellus clavatus TaxID=660517 RepID=A0A1H3GCI3_9EURY|nr:lycopene cyclase domain-containing protein [Halobellus clavatus]SDY00996.1 lycopene cyclase domain-containing protein [Halobellus clavatus]